MDVQPLRARRAKVSRPALTAALSSAEFRRWYWLRTELAQFCRAHGLPAGGGKIDLADRIAHHLDGAPPSAPARAPGRPGREAAAAPTPSGLVPPDVRCDQRLRAFFVGQVGSTFRYTVRFQQWLHDNAGASYADAVAAWHVLARDRSPGQIAPQFEYNRFTRAFRLTHPGTTHKEVTTAWQEHRSAPRSEQASSLSSAGQAPAADPAAPDAR